MSSSSKDHYEDVWVILFEDPDVPYETFTDAISAKKRLDTLRLNWSCNLFRRVI